MAQCEKLSACPFFNDKMANKPGMTNLFKNNYCLKDNSQCARYMVATKLGKEKVPTDMYPNEVERATKLIAG